MSFVPMPAAMVSHGGGPWPVLPLWGSDLAEPQALAACMRSLADVL